MTKKSIVSIVKAESYDNTLVEAQMRACLEPLGGMQAFVSSGQKVLLKPNILGSFSVDKAVTTHPAIVRAAIILIKECGATAIVGDSPGIGSLAQALKVTGIGAVIAETGAEIAEFTAENDFENQDNKIGKHLKLAQAVSDADVIISLPKLKTHVQMAYTGAVKNQFGLVVGAKKSNYHFRLKTRESLAALMVDINLLAKPSLAIFDAIDGMEGEGPSGGSPRHIGLIMASSDLTALDATACRIIEIEPISVATISAALNIGYGVVAQDQITLAGGLDLKDITVKDFKKVEHFKSILGVLPLPAFMLKWLDALWAPKPRIDAKLCILCNRCHDGCPIKPSAIEPSKVPKKHVNDKSCIRCYCCHEFCPVKAIKLKRSWIDRVLNFSALFEASSKYLGKILSKFSI